MCFILNLNRLFRFARVTAFVSFSAERVEKGASAKDFCDKIVAALGCGKGGGKADLANASFPLSETVTVDSVKALALELSNV